MSGDDAGTGEFADDEAALALAAFDALPAQVAVLDETGTILATNGAWAAFGTDNDLQGDAEMVGENYLAVCDASNDDDAERAAAGIRSVLDGERTRFAFEYPCHSPDERRWFIMRALELDAFEEPHVLVMHTDITDRKEAELGVERHNDTLETVASVLSHDLRNPLNVVLGLAETLAFDPDTDPDTVADRASSIAASADRMDTIIDDALVLARRTDDISTEPVDLGTVAAAAWSHVETGPATLSVGETATIEADESLLSQLFENLFRNAIEHGSTDRDGTGSSRNGAAVTVTVTATDGGFAVSDDGPGVPAADRESVFEAGYSTGDDGTGLGLSIVTAVADAHGWEVSLTEHPNSEGSGARFEFDGVSVH